MAPCIKIRPPRQHHHQSLSRLDENHRGTPPTCRVGELRCGVVVRRPPRVGLSNGAPRWSRPTGSGTDWRASGPRRRMLGGRRWPSSGDVPRDCRRRAPSMVWVLKRLFLPRGLKKVSRCPAMGWVLRHPFILGEESAHRPRPRTPPPPVPSAAPAHHLCPTTPVAPGHGRTWRHRSGILRLRTPDSRGRPPPDASAGRRRRPRRTVHQLSPA
jgi:hypothetical protein